MICCGQECVKGFWTPHFDQITLCLTLSNQVVRCIGSIINKNSTVYGWKGHILINTYHRGDDDLTLVWIKIECIFKHYQASFKIYFTCFCIFLCQSAKVEWLSRLFHENSCFLSNQGLGAFYMMENSLPVRTP